MRFSIIDDLYDLPVLLFGNGTEEIRNAERLNQSITRVPFRCFFLSGRQRWKL